MNTTLPRTPPCTPWHTRLWTTGRWWLAAGLTAALAACGGGSGSGGAEGRLTVHLTDAPACGYEHVYVTVEAIRVHQNANAENGQGGWSEIVLDDPQRVDLLTLTNGVMEELGQTTLPAGDYQQIRLVLARNGNSAPYANAIVRTGESFERALKTPSAQQSGLKLNAHFNVPAGETADIVLDFDACRSIVQAGNSGQWLLKPVIRVLPLPDAATNGLTVQGYAAPGATVSLQREGVVERATFADDTGLFVLSPLPEAGLYDLVITGEGLQTWVVTDVPVSADEATVLNSEGSPFMPGASAMRTVQGNAEAGDEETSVTVSAQQVLAGGRPVEVAVAQANAETGAYTLALPLEAPLVAAYDTGSLVFAPLAEAAGLYTLVFSAPEFTAQAVDIDAADGDVMTDYVAPDVVLVP